MVAPELLGSSSRSCLVGPVHPGERGLAVHDARRAPGKAFCAAHCQAVVFCASRLEGNLGLTDGALAARCGGLRGFTVITALTATWLSGRESDDD